MNRLIAILFVLIIVAQTVHQGIIYTYYVINKDYISTILCENKEEPELKCDGKCHLRTMLNINKEEPLQEQGPIPNLEEIRVPLLFFEVQEAYQLCSFQNIGFEASKQYFSYLFEYSFLLIAKVLDPPQV